MLFKSRSLRIAFNAVASVAGFALTGIAIAAQSFFAVPLLGALTAVACYSTVQNLRGNGHDCDKHGY